MAVVLRDATMLRDLAGRGCAPASDVQIACYFSDPVWTHHVQPVDGREPAPELRRAYDGLEAAWREALAVRGQLFGPRATAAPRDPADAARLHQAARPRLEAAARRADAALAAAEARKAEWMRRALEATESSELRRRQQAGNAAALLARTLRIYRSWLDAAYPPPPEPRAA
jgi:hypothetical protein